MPYKILGDEDVDHLISMADAIEAIESALREQAGGTLIAPPRFHVETDKGALVFTAGGATQRAQAIGFRVYDTFPGNSPDRTQLVAVFDSASGGFKGMIIGHRLGRLRTGAIGGIAVKYMSRPESRTAAILGSGHQARTQLEALVVVRSLDVVTVYSPTRARREAFASEMSEKLGVRIKATESPTAAVSDADIVIAATRSPTPVFHMASLKPGAHVTTLGPQMKDAHEIPADLPHRSSLIATDSIDQVAGYGPGFLLVDTPEHARLIGLSDIVAGKHPGRTSPTAISLFHSVGLAGTEVVVGDAALRRAQAGAESETRRV